MIKITSCTAFTAAEGLRLSYTYSEINEDGAIEKSNVRKDIIVMDKDLEKEINDIFNFLEKREARV